MALWGNKDLVADGGTISIDFSSKTVTGAGTSFTDATYGIAEGDVFVVGAGGTYGEAVVASVTDATTAVIKDTDHFASGITTVPALTTYIVTQQPVYALGAGATERGTTTPTASVYGVDELEVAAAKGTTYEVTHSGWVAVGATYTDCNNNVRIKHEVLVAGGISTVFDANDDTVFPDA